MNETKIIDQLMQLLDAKTANKRREMESLSQPLLDRTDQYNHRKFQVEVEYWQLLNLFDEMQSVITAAGVDFAVKNGTSEAGAAKPKKAPGGPK